MQSRQVRPTTQLTRAARVALVGVSKRRDHAIASFVRANRDIIIIIIAIAPAAAAVAV